MEKEPYVESTVLIYDTKLHLRKQTRSVLNIIGFWKIEECESLKEARLVLSSRQVELAMFTVEHKEDGVAHLVNDLRRFRCGADPFLPVILTSWDAKLRLVRTIINSGADDFVVSPYSTAKLKARVDALVRHRKPFVVSDEYFGPDRRTMKARANDAGTVEVPNALRAKVMKRPAIGPNQETIEATLSQLRLVKVRNIARRMWAIADALYRSYEDPSLPDWIDRELIQILKCGRAFQESLQPRETAELGGLCDAVINVTNTIRNERPSEKNLELLEQSALALRVASQLGGDGAVAASEISSVVAGIGSSTVTSPASKTDQLVKSVLG